MDEGTRLFVFYPLRVSAAESIQLGRSPPSPSSLAALNRHRTGQSKQVSAETGWLFRVVLVKAADTVKGQEPVSGMFF